MIKVLFLTERAQGQGTSMGAGQMLRHGLPHQRLHPRLGHPRPAQR
jgi:hypothetical protein